MDTKHPWENSLKNLTIQSDFINFSRRTYNQEELKKHRRNRKIILCERARETQEPLQRHALIDYRDGNKVLKVAIISRQKAYDNNQTLRGTGLAWARQER